MTRLAAVDIGSNTLLLLIAEVRNGELVVLRDECNFGRLGKGIDQRGALADDAVERSLQIIEQYRALIDEAKVDRIAVVGTQALREASNAASFIEPAERMLGRPIEVIAGEREAALVYRSVAESLPELLADGERDVVIADVGGASTEIICGRGGEVAWLVSVPIGAVRLSERHLKGDPPTAAEGRQLIADIDAELGKLTLPRGAAFVGTAGTATTFATVEQKLRTWQPERVQGYRLSIAQVDRQLARFLELPLHERRHMPGLEPARADVIAGGAAIYARLGHALGAGELVISDRGVRWGLLYELR